MLVVLKGGGGGARELLQDLKKGSDSLKDQAQIGVAVKKVVEHYRQAEAVFAFYRRIDEFVKPDEKAEFFADARTTMSELAMIRFLKSQADVHVHKRAEPSGKRMTVAPALNDCGLCLTCGYDLRAEEIPTQISKGIGEP